MRQAGRLEFAARTLRRVVRVLRLFVRVFGFDATDLRTVLKFALQCGFVLAGAATAGLAVRIFLMASGFGG